MLNLLRGKVAYPTFNMAAPIRMNRAAALNRIFEEDDDETSNYLIVYNYIQQKAYTYFSIFIFFVVKGLVNIV